MRDGDRPIVIFRRAFTFFHIRTSQELLYYYYYYYYYYDDDDDDDCRGITYDFVFSVVFAGNLLCYNSANIVVRYVIIEQKTVHAAINLNKQLNISSLIALDIQAISLPPMNRVNKI